MADDEDPNEEMEDNEQIDLNNGKIILRKFFIFIYLNIVR
jgi:hypothetical protein